MAVSAKLSASRRSKRLAIATHIGSATSCATSRLSLRDQPLAGLASRRFQPSCALIVSQRASRHSPEPVHSDEPSRHDAKWLRDEPKWRMPRKELPKRQQLLQRRSSITPIYFHARFKSSSATFRRLRKNIRPGSSGELEPQSLQQPSADSLLATLAAPDIAQPLSPQLRSRRELSVERSL